MEIQRVAALPIEEGKKGFTLDGTILVVDVENWKGYEDTSYTAKVQAKYTDLVVMNKWEDVGERKLDDAVDRVRDLNDETPWVRSHRGRVEASVVFGMVGSQHHASQSILTADSHQHNHAHDEKSHNHTSEVDVLSITLPYDETSSTINVDGLEKLLESAPKDEVYRMKGILYSTESSGNSTVKQRYILNWAFGRHTLTKSASPSEQEPALRMTMVLARGEGGRWKKKLAAGSFIRYDGEGVEAGPLQVNVIA